LQNFFEKEVILVFCFAPIFTLPVH